MAAFLLTLALSFPFFHKSPAATKLPPELAERVVLSLVQVTMEVYNEETEQMETHVCAGWVTSASKGEAITARHCVDADEQMYVDGVESEIIRANDLFALLSVPRMTKPPLDLATENPVMGAMVVSVGYGYGKLMVFVRNVAAFSDEDGADDIVLGGPLPKGMSGGPTVDEYGRVVGLNQASNQVIGIVCGVSEMRKFLNSK